MQSSRFFSIVLAVVSFGLRSFAQSHPDLKEIHDRALEAKSRLRVLSLALKPGFEDFSTLAYWRQSKGAKVTSAYLTNGENSEGDVFPEYPHERAATLRREALEAMTVLEVEPHFLNFTDFGFSEDTSLIAEHWPRGQLRKQLSDLIDRFRPDLILVPRDAEAKGWSTRWGFVTEHLILAVQQQLKRMPGRDTWEVAKLIVDDGLGRGTGFPLDRRHPINGSSPFTLASTAMESYLSLGKHSFMIKGPRKGTYRIEFPSGKMSQSLESDLPPRIPAKFRALDSAMLKLCNDIQRQSARNAVTQERGAGYLRTVAQLIDSVELRIASPENMGSKDRKILVGWKEGLEGLRNVLLGAKLSYSLSDGMLVSRQLTYLTIDSLLGESKGGSTSVYFPGVGYDGWIVDENWNQQLPFRTGAPYRLVSPQSVDFSLPASVNGITTNEYGSPLWFFVFHQSPNRERNFVIKVKER
ncbi:MAG: PIG-L family deacetylase, partial [Bacteroidota bacterium]